VDVETNLKAYLAGRNPAARYASFDYCFNHFQSFREERQTAALQSPAVMELSCLHLGFFLASWGMYRGSSELLQHSIKHLVPVIEVVASVSDRIWLIDAHVYSEGAIDDLMATARQIRAALPEGASDTLVTKTMLGVFGNVPAFDTYFRKGFGVTTFGRKSLRKIGQFYQANREAIDGHRILTLDFASGRETSRAYTRAKVIDMIFFVEGGSPTA
jgi:hypothetical protein